MLKIATPKMSQNEKYNYKLIGNNLFSLDYNEFYKSDFGPRQESRHVFIKHVDFKKLSKHSLQILEIGFGPGTNFFELIESLEKKKIKKKSITLLSKKTPLTKALLRNI